MPTPTPTTTTNTTTPPRPTNIPPPSTLLQLLPQIFSHLATQSRQTPSLPSPALATSIHNLHLVTAHIIAGRPHRHKRDQHLASSTRISPANLRNIGMKLTALDRSSTIKEDQDVAEVIAAWQQHSPGFNAVVLKANKLAGKPTALSQLRATMPVKVEKGALGAKECCAVCGLRREERVVGVDVRVEDSFGEWWVEWWGHRVCCDWWYMHEGMLERR